MFWTNLPGDPNQRAEIFIVLLSSIVAFFGSMGSIGLWGMYSQERNDAIVEQVHESDASEVPFDLSDVDDEPALQVLSDWALRVWCFAGSIVGAWCYIFLVPDKKAADIRRLSGKFIAAAGTGVMFTPMVMTYFKIPLTVDWTAGISTVVAFSAIGILVQAGPTIKDWAITAITSITNMAGKK